MENMPFFVSITELRNRTGEVLRAVRNTQNKVYVSISGRPVATLMGITGEPEIMLLKDRREASKNGDQPSCAAVRGKEYDNE